MKEVKCTIIQDILPLYVDEVISPDTKEMVEEHLQHCLSCQQELESMKRDLILPAETMQHRSKPSAENGAIKNG